MRSLLFDASALVALFDAHDRVYALWAAAEESSVPVLLPATAIAEANRKLRATDAAWNAVLLGHNVAALDLTPATALAASRRGGDLAVAHASVEAGATGATIVTAHPDAYDPVLPTVPF
jgi:predicted nucleic acid-binding protein